MVAATPPLRAGQRREQVIYEELLRTNIVQYAGVSGDYSPMHTDEVHARDAGYPGVMAHGMMVMAAASTVLTDWVGVENLTQLSARFLAPVWPGDRLMATVKLEVVRHEDDGVYGDFGLAVINHDGADVFGGTATAQIGAARR